MSHDTRKFDFVEKAQVRVGDLVVGMYVCELDRDWLETPFLLQGFEITSDADIEEIRKHCEYVYIDVRKTKTIRPEYNNAAGKSYFAAPPPKRVVSFAKEIETARSAQTATTSLIKTFIEDIQFGRGLDVQIAKSAVNECVASVIRNPDALMFLTQLRERDEYTSQHSFNVCVLAIVLGRATGMGAKDLENLGTAALLHDMGKIKTPKGILNKEGRLTVAEFEIMKEHTTHGRDILMSGRTVFSGSVDVAYGHHENMDGSGYPRGLQGHQLGLNTKYVAVVDKYDAITSDRVYQLGKTHTEGLNILNQLGENEKIDKRLVLSFTAAIGIFPPGSIVELSTGEIGVVLAPNPEHRLRPQIIVVRDANRKPVRERFMDLKECLVDSENRPYKITRMHRVGDFGIDVRKYQNLIATALG